MSTFRLKRAYDAPADDDGQRFLVDRLWPRGRSKESLVLTAWLQDAAPSHGLRRWFGHDPKRWDKFRRLYFAELDSRPEALAPLYAAARRGRVTLVFAAKDPKHNNAAALQEYLQNNL